MTLFRRCEDGFVLLFTLLILPVFVGFGLLIIDMGRANNAHADLQAAADAVALAGARELDGGVDAITRAQAAMAEVTNSVSMLGVSGPDMHIELVYEDVNGNEFQIQFLTAIPSLDTTPLTSAWLTANEATTEPDAEYVYVRAESRNLTTAFFNPLTYLRENVPVVASAVAMGTTAACDIPPIYVCNPFEFTSGGVYAPDQLQTEFNAGNLHGRLIRLHPPGPGTHAPGNFGFLQVNGSNSAAALRAMFAGARNPTCYDANTVQTNPGAQNSVSAGINTRFDIYEAPYQINQMGNLNFSITPAQNTRKGALPDAQLNGPNLSIDDCLGNSPNNGAQIVDDHVYDPAFHAAYPATDGFNADGITENAYGLPDNNIMLGVNSGVPGAAIGANHNWPITTYFTRNYGTGAGAPNASMVTSAFTGLTPSRYDVYLAEIANGWTSIRAPGDQVGGFDTGEMAAPNCGHPSVVPDLTIPDRRIIVGAIIDCGNGPAQGGGTTEYEVNSYASMFMARPMVSYGPSTDMTIDVEIVDISGYGGNGTLEEFIREEAILVR